MSVLWWVTTIGLLWFVISCLAALWIGRVIRRIQGPRSDLEEVGWIEGEIAGAAADESGARSRPAARLPTAELLRAAEH